MLKVLVVENNPVILKIISSHLEKEGCEVLTAIDGLAALNILDSIRPDILFIDLIMPRVSGDQLCGIIRRDNYLKDIFIAVHSATILEYEQQMIDIGADVYIAKGPKINLKAHVLHVLKQYKNGIRRSQEIRGREGFFAREITKELLLVRKHYHTIFNSIAEAVVEMDDTGQIVQANLASVRILRKEAHLILSSNLKDYISGPGAEDAVNWINQAGRSQSQKFTSSYDNPLLVKNRKILLNMVAIKEDEDIFIIGILQDISQQKKTEEELEKALAKVSTLANHDPLTGLPNLRLAKENLTNSISLSKRRSWTTAVMFIDLDDFKRVNDLHGHDFGDKVLKKVADKLVGSLRQSESVARIGGDEFLIILTDIGHRSNIAKVAEKIILNISEPFLQDDQEIHVGASIGIAIFPEDGDNSKILLKKADDAMYFSKRKEKNSYSFSLN